MKFYKFIKMSTCFKSPDRPSCDGLKLTNKIESFQTSKIIETDKSDFHKMVMTVLNVYFKKKGPSVSPYCDMTDLEMIYVMN